MREDSTKAISPKTGRLLRLEPAQHECPVLTKRTWVNSMVLRLRAYCHVGHNC